MLHTKSKEFYTLLDLSYHLLPDCPKIANSSLDYDFTIMYEKWKFPNLIFIILPFSESNSLINIHILISYWNSNKDGNILKFRKGKSWQWRYNNMMSRHFLRLKSELGGAIAKILPHDIIIFPRLTVSSINLL